MELTDRECARVLQYVEAQKEIQFPVTRIAVDVLLASFGWSEAIGKKKAKMAIETLERKGEIECDRSSKTLKSIRVKIHEKSETPIVADKPKMAFTEDVRPHSFKNFPNRPKGRAKELHKGFSRGDANEAFFYKSCERLVEILTTKFPTKVTFGNCTRSGRNNPKDGKIDLQDRYGEDVGIQLTVRDEKGPLRKVFLIYDSKSSKCQAKKFNGHIKLFPGQKSADLKKAIWVDKKIHTERDLIEEILNDVVGLSLIDQGFKDEILRCV